MNCIHSTLHQALHPYGVINVDPATMTNAGLQGIKETTGKVMEFFSQLYFIAYQIYKVAGNLSIF